MRTIGRGSQQFGPKHGELHCSRESRRRVLRMSRKVEPSVFLTLNARRVLQVKICLASWVQVGELGVSFHERDPSYICIHDWNSVDHTESATTGDSIGENQRFPRGAAISVEAPRCESLGRT